MDCEGIIVYLGSSSRSFYSEEKKYTETQTMLSSIERKQNMDKSFEVKKPLKGITIGIVDDVLTTGSTMSACAVMLKEKGFQSVFAISCSTPKLEKKKD